MTKVSVIIPVYNSKDYLKKCFDSLCNQILKDIEIICINDCSSDNSLDILNEYAKNDKRIRIINFSKNKGVAVARNTAMRQAKGEYIGFVDSDDWIDLDFYEKLYIKAKKENADVVIGNIAEDNMQTDYKDNFKKIYENKAYFNKYFTSGIYNKLFTKKYNLHFIENCCFGEDRLFPIQASYYSKSFRYILDTYYHYVRNNKSATLAPFSIDKIHSIIQVISEIQVFMNKGNYSEKDYLITIEDLLENIFSIISFIPVNFRQKYFEFINNFILNLKFKDKENNNLLIIEKFLACKNYTAIINYSRQQSKIKLFSKLRQQINEGKKHDQ